MIPYPLRKAIFCLLVWLPIPFGLIRFLRFVVRVKMGENTGDIDVNGEGRLLQKQIKNCAIVFDVGAHIGDWTAYALKLNPNAQFHCFEPLKEHYQKLVENISHKNIIANNFGCSDQAQVVSFNKQNNSLYTKYGSAPPELFEQVKLTTIDQYCRDYQIKRIDFLKIDTEGHDLLVIRGAKNLFDQELILRVQFEYSNFNIYSRTLLRDFFEFFETRPYKIYLIKPKTLQLIPRYNPELENFTYKNFIVLHQSIAK